MQKQEKLLEPSEEPTVAAPPRAAGRGDHQFKGSHLLATYRECDPAVLSDAARCLQALSEAALAAGARIVGNSVHSFPNGGVTAVLLLAESHASIHTYPEYGACFVDFFTCGSVSVDNFSASIRRSLKSNCAELKVVSRL